LMVDIIRWDEKAGLRRNATRSQVIDALKAQEIKETGNERRLAPEAGGARLRWPRVTGRSKCWQKATEGSPPLAPFERWDSTSAGTVTLRCPNPSGALPHQHHPFLVDGGVSQHCMASAAPAVRRHSMPALGTPKETNDTGFVVCTGHFIRNGLLVRYYANDPFERPPTPRFSLTCLFPRHKILRQ
jgi:hypothetical protein